MPVNPIKMMVKNGKFESIFFFLIKKTANNITDATANRKKANRTGGNSATAILVMGKELPQTNITKMRLITALVCFDIELIFF